MKNDATSLVIEGASEEMGTVLSVLMDIAEGHPHALHSAGIHPDSAKTMDSMLEQVRQLIVLYVIDWIISAPSITNEVASFFIFVAHNATMTGSKGSCSRRGCGWWRW